MDSDFWVKYAKENDAKYNPEFAKFIRDLALSLGCNSILEVGCSTGIDLKLFSDEVKVHGLDQNEYAISIARNNLPSVDFKIGTITNMPYEDSSIDFIFTHGLLNYLHDSEIDAAVSELYRVSRRYIVNCELYDEKESRNDNITLRNMYARWNKYNVKIISNVDMHEEIDPEKSRFTLVKKLE